MAPAIEKDSMVTVSERRWWTEEESPRSRGWGGMSPARQRQERRALRQCGGQGGGHAQSIAQMRWHVLAMGEFGWKEWNLGHPLEQTFPGQPRGSAEEQQDSSPTEPERPERGMGIKALSLKSSGPKNLARLGSTDS